MENRISYKRSTFQFLGLFTAPFFALAIYLLLPETYQNSHGQIIQFTHAGKITAATGVWMAIWWMTEAIPVYATALLPIAVLPVTGAASIKQTCVPYGNELIFLFMGGFILALSMQRWGLHKRISFFVLRLVGTKPQNMVAGFMVITAMLSMWVSNTATAVMMLPIALSVIDLVISKENNSSVKINHICENDDRQNFAICMMLGIAYSAASLWIFHPLHIIVPATISASCAFMLPVATPPNAVVFGSGYITIPQMCKAGFWLIIIGILLITGLTYAIAIPLLL